MISTHTLKKGISVAIAFVLALGSSLIATAPAYATPSNTPSSSTSLSTWANGEAVTIQTAPVAIQFESVWVMSDISGFHDQEIEITANVSAAGGLVEGATWQTFAYIETYATSQDALDDANRLGTFDVDAGVEGTLMPSQNTGVNAMRVTFVTVVQRNFDLYSYPKKLPVDTYSATHRLFIGGQTIGMSSSSALDDLDFRTGLFAAVGMPNGFRSPVLSAVAGSTYKIFSCLDRNLINVNTNLTATISVLGELPGSRSETEFVFDSAGLDWIRTTTADHVDLDLATRASWFTNSDPIFVTASAYLNMSLNDTYYNTTLEIVDQNNVSVLGDCRPPATLGAGALSTVNNQLVFTPDSTVAQIPNWGVQLFRASDDVLVSTNYSSTPNPLVLSGPLVNEVATNLPVAREYYTRVFVVEFPYGDRLTPLESDLSPTRSATFLYRGSATPPVVTADATDPVVPPAEDLVPLPAWARQLVEAVPTLQTPRVSTGGSASLTNGDYSDLKSVSIGGKTADFKLGANGSVTIPIPAGETRKSADITVVFAGGTMVIQDGIRYAEATDVSKVPERSISIKSGAKKLSASAVDQTLQAAFASMKNDSIACVGYASANNGKAKVAAKATAKLVCERAAKANPALANTGLTVLVNNAKSKSQAVGIKVYKATN